MSPPTSFSSTPAAVHVRTRAGSSSPVVIAGLAQTAALALLVVAAFQDAVPADHLLREPQTVAGQRWYVGALSTLGSLLWAAGGALLALAAATCAGAGRRCYALGAAVTLLLAFDDAFLVHDQLLPAIGLDDKAAYAVYASLSLLWLARGWRVLRRGPWPLLALAFGWLGLSVGLDAVFNQLPQLFEDGAKLLGISAWTAWAWLTATAAATGTRASRPVP